MSNTVRIENWSTERLTANPYQAPELGVFVLVGTVYGHHRKEDGSVVVTTQIMKSEGRIVTTRSGTVYELGQIHPDYAAWCEKNGIKIDPAQPVKVLR